MLPVWALWVGLGACSQWLVGSLALPGLGRNKGPASPWKLGPWKLTALFLRAGRLNSCRLIPLQARKQPRAANQHRLDHYSPVTPAVAAGAGAGVGRVPARRWRALPREPDISGNWASSLAAFFLSAPVSQ